MKFYKTLSFIPKYSLKFLLIAFLGIHIPLLGIIVYIIVNPTISYTPTEVILVALALTLVGSFVTLYLLNQLLKPVTLSKKSLEEYSNSGTIPQLPTHYKDEVGILMTQIQKTIEDLNKLLTEKEDILSLASHDLRSPATQIKGLTYLLKGEDDKEAISEYCDIIEKQADKQMELLQNIIILLKSGRTLNSSITKTEIKLAHFIENCIDLNQSLFNAKKLTINLTNVDNEVAFYGEKVLLSQAVQNIFTNAIKFSNTGDEIKIDVSYINGYVKILVKDKGIGFDPSVSEKLFDRFTLEGKKGTKNEGTTGLGLYLTKKIIEGHQGKIEAHSEGVNKGAEFTILLPYN